ncbi:MAG: hypothetical protein ACRC80_25975 [Waterburya sp.]
MDTLSQKRNLDHLTQARNLQAFLNANRGENTPAIEDVANLLPHPATWMKLTGGSKLQIGRKGAIEFLQTYKSFSNTELISVFDDWMFEITTIASQ